MFLETPNFAFNEAKGECSNKAVYKNCQARVTKAWSDCRSAFAPNKPTHEMLLQVQDTAAFVKLAGQFSQDGHSHVFDYTATEELVQTYSSGYTSGPTDGPAPSATQVDEEKDQDSTDNFRAMQTAAGKVKEDREDVPDEEDFTNPEKVEDGNKLDLAIKKCTQLKADTFTYCAKEMCKYHDECGTANSVKQCKDQTNLRKIAARHKETSFKMARRAAEMKREKAAELKVKGPELKTKAAAKEKKWKFNSPERAAKKLEDKEIDEKAKKMVNGWIPGGYKLEDNNPFKITSQKKGDRRLLAADDKVLDSEAEEAKLKGIHDAEVAKALAVKTRMDSPMCKAMASTAFDRCQALTERAYDTCTDELNKADSTFVASLQAAKRVKEVPYTSAKVVEDEAKGMPAVTEPVAAKVAAAGSPQAAAAYASEAKAVKATAAVVPAPVGQAKPAPQVATDVAVEHENDVAAADALGQSQEAVTNHKYTTATNDARVAVKTAEANVEAAKTTANADLADSSVETKDIELYEQQQQLYESEIEDTFEEEEDLQ